MLSIVDKWAKEPGATWSYELPLPQTIYNAIKLQAGLRPDAIAVMAPGCEPLSYRRLIEQIKTTVCRFNELGVGRNDWVGLLAPNGSQRSGQIGAVMIAAYLFEEYYHQYLAQYITCQPTYITMP